LIWLLIVNLIREDSHSISRFHARGLLRKKFKM